MPKTTGAITKNKNIFWKVALRDQGIIQEKTYSNLKELCNDLNIDRSNVYRIRNGISKPLRKNKIISIDKFLIT